MNEEQSNKYPPAFGDYLFYQFVFRLILLAAFGFIIYVCWLYKIHNQFPIGFIESTNHTVNDLFIIYMSFNIFNNLYKWSK